MLSYCLLSRKNAKNKNPEVAKTKHGSQMLLLHCLLLGSKKPNFIKEQESSGILISLGLKIPLNKIILAGPILF